MMFRVVVKGAGFPLTAFTVSFFLPQAIQAWSETGWLQYNSFKLSLSTGDESLLRLEMILKGFGWTTRDINHWLFVFSDCKACKVFLKGVEGILALF